MTLLEHKERLAQGTVKYLPHWITPMDLTILRIALVLPMILFFLNGQIYLTAILLIISALLDFYDGPLARLRQQTSLAGKLLDPFADKLMIIPLFYFTAINILPHWLIWSIIIIESLLVITAFIIKPSLQNQGYKFSLGANLFGKYKTTLEFAGVLWLLLIPTNSLINLVSLIVFSLVLILAVGSLIRHTIPLHA